MKGYITISRTSNQDGHKSINITLEDDLSDIAFLEVEMGLEEFANLITGTGYIDCNFVPDGWRYEPSKAAKLLEPYEVDGWIGSGMDLDNWHRHVTNGYKVDFVRWVENKTSEENNVDA